MTHQGQMPRSTGIQKRISNVAAAGLKLIPCWLDAASARLYTKSKDLAAQAAAKKLVKGSGHLSSYDHIRAIDHAMHAAQGWGLEAFLPEKRLVPGEPLQLVPEAPESRLIVNFRLDQLHSGFAGAWFLLEHSGLRARASWDALHRKWNDCKQSAEHAGFKGRQGERTPPCV